MQEIAIVIWAVLAGYTAVCVCVPEMRLFHWKQTDSKLGGISYLGAALFLWSPLLLVLGVISKPYEFLVYGLVILAFLISVVGYLMDTKKL